MNLIPERLGQKLNLTLFLFMLAVGLATAGLVYFGFERTQSNATHRSQEGLEQTGQQLMLTIAQDQASFGELSLEWASDAGQAAARYLADIERSGGSFPFDISGVTRAPNGILYDPNPARRSDLAMPAFAPFGPEAQRDVIESAALDAVFPSVLTSYPGRLRQTNFDAIAVFFTSTHQVTRYYPPIGLEKIAPPDIDYTERLELLGPARNPERRTVWTTPYLDRAGNGQVITAYSPAYFGGSYRGVVGIDLSLDKLLNQIDLVRVTESGFGFYVDRDGNLLKTRSYDLLKGEIEGGNAALRSAIEAIGRGETGVTRFTLGDREVFLAHAPLNNVGGGFGVLAPVDEITAQAAAIRAAIDSEGNRTVLVVLVVIAGFFSAGLVGTTWMNRHLLLRPIEALVQGTRAVAAGETDTVIPVRGRGEMADLAASFNQMAAEIQQRRISLEDEVRERQRAQDELRALFAAMTDTVVVIDKNGLYLRVPTTNAPPILLPPGDLPGKTMAEVMPADQAERFMAIIRRALAEKTTVVEEYPLELDERMQWFSTATSPISDEAVVVVARDITERVTARQELERRVEERTRELQAILEVSRNLTSTLELQPLLKALLDQLKVVADYSRASIFMMEGETLVMIASESNIGANPIGMRLSSETVRAIGEQLDVQGVAMIDDVRADTDLAHSYKSATGDLFETAFRNVRAWMGVPLSVKERMIGLITVSSEQPGAYDMHQAELVKAIANQAAVAIENAQLYEETRRRALEMDVLVRADAELFRSLDLDEVLQTLVDLTVDLLGMHKSLVVRWDAATGEGSVGGARNMSEESVAAARSLATMALREMSTEMEAFVHHGPPPEAPEAFKEILRREHIESFMELPIRSVSGSILGLFAVAFTEHHDFTPDEQRLLKALAERASVAAGNAELYARAQHAASLEERQRLARELHDSVSQALYGIALGASTAREVLSGEASAAQEPVEYVLSLAEAGLAEMRALIFELRPESLEIEGLVAAIEKQVAATRARYGIKVLAELCPEPPIPLRQKEVFYRVTQEAMHNIVKHARASTIDVRLDRNNGELSLEVRDDGIGFDDTKSFPGHMGLVSMAERASAIGASLSISSQPGQGTVVRLASPIEPPEN